MNSTLTNNNLAAINLLKPFQTSTLLGAKSLLTTILLMIWINIQAHPLYFEDAIHNKNIHTIQWHPIGAQEALPVMPLGNTECLILSFDELGEHYKNYKYSFQHCDANWKASELLPNEYVEGFEEDIITDYAFSQNTKLNYTHYSLKFPQEDMQPMISGNYVLFVYEEAHKNQPIMQLRFMVNENIANITALTKESGQILLRQTHQEVDFSVNLQALGYNFPSQNIKVDILQNRNWASLKENIIPKEMKNGIMNFDLQDESNTFWGLNRFRYFDFASQKYNSEYIDRIITEGDTTRIILLASESRNKDKFAEQINMRGAYLIDTRDWQDAATESEYSLVYFTLLYPVPLPNAEVYIMGAFNRWKTEKTNLMQYDYELKAYVGQLLLKQGFYSYLFMLRDLHHKVDDYVFFENSLFDTDNVYNIMVYYRAPGSLYDRLIGFY